jgi:hypothetical protein
MFWCGKRKSCVFLTQKTPINSIGVQSRKYSARTNQITKGKLMQMGCRASAAGWAWGKTETLVGRTEEAPVERGKWSFHLEGINNRIDIPQSSIFAFWMPLQTAVLFPSALKRCNFQRNMY